MATVYAKWVTDASVTVRTVTFNGNGGTWNGTATRATYTLTGETALIAEAPTTAKLGTTAQPPSGAVLSATLSEGLYAGAGVCTFTGWNTAANGSGSAFTASTVVSANTTVYAQWQEPAQWSAYKYDITTISGNNFYEKAMNYIFSNKGNYIIVLGSDASPQNNYGNFTSIGNATSVMLVGVGSRRTISTSANGYLFDVRSGGKLILDRNITLQGSASNNVPLVKVAGSLVMNEGAVITGNIWNGSSEWGGGGVNVASGGTFTMNGGTISNNSAANTSYYGSGGGVYNKGTFTMNGGTISGNAANYTFGGGGVHNEGTFRLITGTIYGNTEADTSLRNTTVGSSGASLLNIEVNGGTATYGTEASGGTSGGSLATSNNTIKAVNGVLTN